MFPRNWDLNRIKEEIAWVYENTVAKGIEPCFHAKGISSFDEITTVGFRLRIQIKNGKIINAFPIIK